MRRPKRKYMDINWNVVRPNKERLRTIALHLWDLAADPNDETSRRPVELIQDHTKQFLRGWFAESEESGRLRQYRQRHRLLLPGHQPEAAIDIMGSPFSNQLEIIRALRGLYHCRTICT